MHYLDFCIHMYHTLYICIMSFIDIYIYIHGLYILCYVYVYMYNHIHDIIYIIYLHACGVFYMLHCIQKNKSQRLSWLSQEKTQQVSLGFSLVTLSTRRCGMCHLNQKNKNGETRNPLLKFGLF